MLVSNLKKQDKQTVKSSGAKAKSSKNADSCNTTSNARYQAADTRCKQEIGMVWRIRYGLCRSMHMSEVLCSIVIKICMIVEGVRRNESELSHE